VKNFTAVVYAVNNKKKSWRIFKQRG